MSLSEVRAVVFDLDGTLVDSMPLVLQGYAHALAPYRPDLGEADLRPLLGGPPGRFFRDLLGDEGAAAEALVRLEDFFRARSDLIAPFAGAGDLLARLRAAGRKIGIWTGRDRESSEWILARHALAASVEALVCGDDLPSHKPDPTGLRAALAGLDVPPAAAVFVGDADVDLLAGAAAGVRTLLISHGRAVAPAVRKLAWRETETPAEAYAWLAAACAAA